MFLLDKITLATITIVTIISQTHASFSGSSGIRGGWNQNQQTRQSFQPWQQQRQQYQPPSPWRNAQYPQQQTRWGDDNSNSNSDSNSNSGGYVFRRPQPDPFYQQFPQPQPQPQPQPDPFYQQLPQPQPQPLPQPNPFYQVPQPQPPSYVQPNPDAFYDQNQPLNPIVPNVIQPQPLPVLPIQPPYVPIPDYGVEPAPVIEILKPNEEDPAIVIVNPPTIGTPQRIPSPRPLIPVTFRPIKVIDSYPESKPVPMPAPIPIVTEAPIPETEEPKYIVKEYYPTTTPEPTTTIDINDIPNRGDSPYSRNGGSDNGLGGILDDIETGYIVNDPQSLIGSNQDPTTETTNIPNTPPVIGKDPELDQKILTDVFGSLLNNLLNKENNAQDSNPTTPSPEVKEFIDSLYSNGNPFAMMNAGKKNSGPKDPMTRGTFSSNAASGANVGAQGFADRPTGEQYTGPNPFLR